MQDAQICENCKFWKGVLIPDFLLDIEENPRKSISGRCKRYPPTVGENSTDWPIVDYDNFCGEFKPIE